MTKDDFLAKYRSPILGILLEANRADAKGLGFHADRWIAKINEIVDEMFRDLQPELPLPVKPATPTTPAGILPAGNQGRPGNPPARPTPTQGR
jgi:hypothetical protein